MCSEGDVVVVFVFKQKTADEMRISDWRSDVCSSDLALAACDRAEGACLRRCRDEEPPHRREGGTVAGIRACEAHRVIPLTVIPAKAGIHEQIGRASCRERVCQYV